MADTGANDDTPIWMCTVEQIVDELRKRHDGGVILAVEKTMQGKVGTDEQGFQCFYRGGFTMAIGLSSRAHNHLLQMDRDKETADNDDED